MNARVAIEQARRATGEELSWARILWRSARGIALELGQEPGTLDEETASRLQAALETLISSGDEAGAARAARKLGAAHVKAVDGGRTKARRRAKAVMA